MRFNALLLAAAGLCLVPAIAAADPAIDSWLGGAKTSVEHRLQAAGVQTGDHMIDVSVRVDSDGRLSNARVVNSTGSRDLDETIAATVRKAHVDAPPPLLSGRALVLHIGVSDTQLAAIKAGHSATN